MRLVMWGSVAFGILLAFAWPFVVSRDPADALFKSLAIGTLMALLVSITVLLVQRARRRS